MLVPFIGLVVPKLTVSLIDSNTGQLLGDNASNAPSTAYTDIQKDKNGKMHMVRHKSKPSSGINSNVTTEDVKENGNDKTEKKNEDCGKTWTPEEDAKLKELKAEGKTWNQIAEDLGRAKHEGQQRFRLINQDGAGGNGGGDENAKKSNEGAGGGGDFTSDDDEKIKKMLADNTSYKKIADELGRTLDAKLKGYITKLKAEGGSVTKAGGNQKKGEGGEKKRKVKGGDGGDKKDEKAIDESKKKEKQPQDKKKDKSAPRNEVQKPSSKAGSTRSRRSEPRFTLSEWKTLQEDELFSFGELQLLMEILMKDSTMSWLRVASRFMDKTGRRVHPDDIKDKFEAMAAIRRRERARAELTRPAIE